MNELTDVEIVYADLAAALDRLNNNRNSPREVRRNFVEFVNLSQKLTSRMRNEYGNKWEASKFNGWNDVTKLFKELRNFEEHEYSTASVVEVTVLHTVPEDNGWPSYDLGMSYIEDPDQLSDDPPDIGIKLMEADPKTGRITNKEIKSTVK